MGPLAAINSGFSGIFTVNGRACRSEYWWFYAFSVLVTVVAFIFDASLMVMAFEASPNPDISFNPLDYFLFYALVVFYIPKKTMTIRRLHDTGKSGFCFLFVFVPLVGSTILFIMTLMPSETDTNIYGSPPHFPGSGAPRRMTTDASGKPRPHDPMQGYAVLDRINEQPSAEMIAARKAQVRALYEQRVIGKPAPV